MGRRGAVRPKPIQPDSLYQNILVSRLINKAMKSGKKTVAQAQVYRAFELVEKKLKKEPLPVFLDALAQIRPRVEVRTRRVGGAAYQVPMIVRGRRPDSLAIRWLVDAARARDNSSYHRFSDKLAAEIIDAHQKEGGAVTKKREIEKVADANTAFAHLRW